MTDRIETRLTELRSMSAEFATAYATRTYIDEFRKSKLALLMKEAERKGHTSAAAQEREARAHPEYVELLDQYRVSVEESERLRWQLEVSKLGVAVWQTQQANERIERRAYGA